MSFVVVFICGTYTFLCAVMYGGDERFLGGKLRERDQCGNLGIYGKKILK
jgi:hypothetical protein